jgi:hypothetical protein
MGEQTTWNVPYTVTHTGVATVWAVDAAEAECKVRRGEFARVPSLEQREHIEVDGRVKPVAPVETET